MPKTLERGNPLEKNTATASPVEAVILIVIATALTYLGIPALVWWLLSTIVPAYTFGYWSTVGLYVAWRLVRGPLVRIPAKKAGA